MNVLPGACMYVQMSRAIRGLQRAPDPLTLELRNSSKTVVYVLRSQPWSSVKAALADSPGFKQHVVEA